MNATPRIKALFASSAALLVFGVIIPANANPDGETGRPAPGSVGQADGKTPPGQEKGNTENGYKCDGNQGAGQGNPALGLCDGSTAPSTPPGNSGSAPGHNGGGGSDGTGTGSGDTVEVTPGT